MRFKRIRKLKDEDVMPFTAIAVSFSYISLILANEYWRFNPLLSGSDYSTFLIALFMALWGLHWFTFEDAIEKVDKP